MKYLKLLLLTLLAASPLLLLTPNLAQAEDCAKIECSRDHQDENQYLDCIKNKKSCWEHKIDEAQQEAITLNNTINILNGQISVQQLQIEQTKAEINTLEKDIEELTNRIAGLSLSLDRLSNILIERIQAHYKQTRLMPSLKLLASDSMTELVTNYKYLKIAQHQTANAMQQAEHQRYSYDEQKTLKEQKQQELEEKKNLLQSQQNQLTQQRAEQEYLLAETKNNEARYQQELAKTLAEVKAIQSIIAGQGEEAKVGEVEKGETIASIIAGASACSTGTHLHFEVVKDGAHRDPAGYLKPVSINWQNQPDASFGFSGDWDWPVNDPALITQGYGMTYYARVKRYYGGQPHSGMDMVSKSGGNYTVKAVKSGTLYRGSIPCGGGLLRYVRVKHQDDGFDSYYLHINY
ncbi:MAG: hypothetical protein GF390_03515 [Candidatus Pacebacteria bacterium]|nr:hypothetical protein [Candidatus Paceibacterota bacterium]